VNCVQPAYVNAGLETAGYCGIPALLHVTPRFDLKSIEAFCERSGGFARRAWFGGAYA
jgi:hypothetical protein